MEEKNEMSRKRKYNFQISHEEVCDKNMAKRVFWDFSQLPDLTLVVEGKELHVHRSLLVNASPVFKVMLESEHFVEKDKNKIELPGKKFDDMQELLNFLYPFWHRITDNTDVENLLSLSREYEMESVKKMCERYLLTQKKTVELLLTAQEFKLDCLKEKCIERLALRNLENVEKHSRFTEIELENFHKISLSRNKQLEKFIRSNLHSQFSRYCDHSSSKHDSTCESCQTCSDSAIHGELCIYPLGQRQTCSW